ncbi:MAG TPA: GxGYxYP domain-containing protein [Armatimonadota bacterium]|nr:GxGYxYP domain-containing protein [Armatimonadota bacterium]
MNRLANIGVLLAAIVGFGVWNLGASSAAPATGLPASIRQEAPPSQSIPGGDYTPTAVWAAAAPLYSHSTGRAAVDRNAASGKAWEVQTGRDPTGLYLLYGPYVDLPPGDYVAFIRIERLSGTDEEHLADIDAAVDFGQNILNSKELTPSDLPVGHYVEIPLGFQDPGGKLEVRVRWTGYASLRVDKVSVFHLTGGNTLALLNRAPEAVLSGLPKNLVYHPTPRTTSDIFPRSNPPARHLFVMDLTKQTPDWQILLLSLQGIVNRQRPEIYALFNNTDPFWLKQMIQHHDIVSAEQVGHPADLIKRFRSRIKGMVITDPALPASRNIATMIAGVDNAVIASPNLARQLKMPVIADLRGRWHTSVDAYRWAFDHLWPRLSHQVISCSYPEQMGLRDYLVENRVFTFWISGGIDGARPYASPTAEAQLMEKLLARMPANIPVVGYPWAGKDVGIGEGPGVTLFAEFAKYLVGSVDASNLSVHSGIRIARFHQRPAPPAPALRNDRVYVSWVMSDGDNLPVLTVYNFPPLWQNPLRGKFPIGWTISPSSYMLIPDVVRYYYSTATPNDDFIGAVSGIGYTYPDHYGERFRPADQRRVFDGFLDQTRKYMDLMNLVTEWPMGITKANLFQDYVDQIPFLQALFPDYGRSVTGYQNATYPLTRKPGDNVPLFHAVTNWSEGIPREQQIANLVSQIHAMTPTRRPAFLHLFIWNWGADLPMLQEVLHRLGPEYVDVRPDQLGALYRQYLKQQKVLVRAPDTVTAIAGQPILFNADLQNVTGHAIHASLRATSGLASVSITPAAARLAPGEVKPVTVTGVPKGNTVDLRLTLPSGARTTPVAMREVPRAEIAGALPARAKLRFVGHYNATDLSHRSGARAADPQARNGAVWAAGPGNAEAGYVIFGPYVTLPPGRYLVLFRLKRTGEGAGLTATIDVSESGGKSVTASRDLTAADLPVGEFRSFPLVIKHVGGPVETRVLWNAHAPIAVDGVDVWRIVTASGASKK